MSLDQSLILPTIAHINVGNNTINPALSQCRQWCAIQSESKSCLSWISSFSFSQDMSAARRRAIYPWGDEYPDDDSTKEIVLQADGLEPANRNDRHVLLYWTKLSISLVGQATIRTASHSTRKQGLTIARPGCASCLKPWSTAISSPRQCLIGLLPMFRSWNPFRSPWTQMPLLEPSSTRSCTFSDIILSVREYKVGFVDHERLDRGQRQDLELQDSKRS